MTCLSIDILYVNVCKLSVCRHRAVFFTEHFNREVPYLTEITSCFQFISYYHQLSLFLYLTDNLNWNHIEDKYFLVRMARATAVGACKTLWSNVLTRRSKYYIRMRQHIKICPRCSLLRRIYVLIIKSPLKRFRRNFFYNSSALFHQSACLLGDEIVWRLIYCWKSEHDFWESKRQKYYYCCCVIVINTSVIVLLLFLLIFCYREAAIKDMRLKLVNPDTRKKIFRVRVLWTGEFFYY